MLEKRNLVALGRLARRVEAASYTNVSVSLHSSMPSIDSIWELFQAILGPTRKLTRREVPQL